MTRRSARWRAPILLFFLVLTVAPARAPAAAPIKTTARFAFLMEFPNRRILLEKRAYTPMPPSSMTKLMTAYLVFEALQNGDLKLSAPVRVSRRAAKTIGSRLGLRAGQTHRLGALVRAMVVYSANDATKAIAEHISGTEAAFARRMTLRARDLGLRNSSFRNATGFTAQGHHMSASDIATLAGLIIAKYPEYYADFALRRFKFRGRAFRNRNPVLGAVKGADGLKTGQTRAGGFGLVAAARRGDRRLILVINGLKSAAARKREAVRLLEWGFRQPAR